MMNEPIDLLQSLDVGKIQAASRNAAWGTLLGGLIVITAIIFSVFRIRTLDREMDVRVTQIQELEKTIEPLNRRWSELKDQVREKEEELKALESKLKIAREQEQVAIAKKGASDRQLDVARASKAAFEELVSANFAQFKDVDLTKDPVELLRVGVVPRATAEPLRSGTDKEKSLYSFSLWLEYRDERVKEAAAEQLESVVYTFNHISFGSNEKDRQRISTDKANAFRVGYEGWGAMSNVIIELRLRGGKSARLDFDMHAALPPELDVPVKGPRPPRPPALRD